MRLLVAFDLRDAESADYDRAYAMFERLGLDQAPQGTKLPRTCVIGEWYSHVGHISELRELFTALLFRQGLCPTSLLVVEFEQASWVGKRVR